MFENFYVTIISLIIKAILEKAKSRTIGGLFNDHEGYKQYCIGKTKKQQMEGARMFHNVTKCPILSNKLMGWFDFECFSREFALFVLWVNVRFVLLY